MSMQDDLQEALTELEAELNSPQVRYPAVGGKVYPCVISTLQSGVTLVIGGNEEQIQFTVLIRKNAVSVSTEDDAQAPTGGNPTADENLPQLTPQKAIAVKRGPGWRNYRILDVAEDGAGASWECHLGSLHRR